MNAVANIRPTSWSARTLTSIEFLVPSGTINRSFARIMGVVKALEPGHVLVLRAPFEPIRLYDVLGSRVGTMPVPTMPELSWPRAEGAAYVLLTAGFIGLAGALAVGSAGSIRAAGIILSLGPLAFGAALVRVLCHLFSRASTETRAPADKPIVGSPQGSRA
jgi:hypothetical protein